MLYRNVRVLGYYLRFIDAAALGGTSAAVWWYGTRTGIWPRVSTDSIVVFCATIMLSLIAVGGSMRAYHARRTERLSEELACLLEISLYAAGVACIITEIARPGLPGKAYLAILISNMLALMIVRLAMRIVIRGLRAGGSDSQTWLIVGHNSRAARLANGVLRHPHFGVRIEEIIDLPQKPGHAANGRLVAMAEVLSRVPSRTVPDVETVRHILSNRIIDEVAITLPYRTYYDEIQQILDMCCEAGISVKLPPEAFDAPAHRTEVSQVANMSVVTHYTGPANHAQLAAKRFIDILGSSAGLLLLSPLFALIAIAVKLNSAGSVFYVQERVGLHGRHFQLVKFRSMCRDSHQSRSELRSFNEAEGIAFKIRNDPRVTTVGRALRKFWLDELPQLWNVLIGDMSLVGPRPLVPGEAHGDEWWQRRRLSMPPGITCFWQITGDHRMPFRQWMQLDLAYIDAWSVWLDLKLIARTVTTVVHGDGW